MSLEEPEDWGRLLATVYGEIATQTYCSFKVRSNMKWDAVGVKAIAPLALRVQFADCTVRTVQFETSHLTGLFRA